MKPALIASAALSLVWACAHPTGEPEADEPTSSHAPVASGGSSAGRAGSSGIGGSKSNSNAGSAGKPGKVTPAALGGAGGEGAGDEPEPSDAGQPGVVDPGPTAQTGDLVVQYRTGNASPSDNQIGPHLRIVSSALAPIDLSALSLRYYFSSEPAPPLLVEQYTAAAEGTSGYRALPSGSVVVTPLDGFVELSFTEAAGLLDAGGQVTVEIAIHDTGWNGLFNESDDYSFDAAHSSFAAWDHVTLYDGKTLLSGIEPP